jgi:hypothetical protein
MSWATCLIITPLLPLASVFIMWLIFRVFNEMLHLDFFPSIILTAVTTTTIVVGYSKGSEFINKVKVIEDVFTLLLYWPFVLSDSLKYLIALLTLGVTRLALAVLHGPNRIRGFIVGVGIIFYVLGGVFQILSTF